ncbi:unnamed protein product [Citrullus colocynthis]|uniref:Uncharacterized protein n=1 Tax=Citrullus colocynthis TaxID=252529 RepID=A0ABP0XKY3_9ROSI
MNGGIRVLVVLYPLKWSLWVPLPLNINPTKIRPLPLPRKKTPLCLRRGRKTNRGDSLLVFSVALKLSHSPHITDYPFLS